MTKDNLKTENAGKIPEDRSQEKISITIPEDRSQEKISITIPKVGLNEDPYVLVGVNFEYTQIPRGKPVMVSRKIYEILSRSDSAKIVTEANLIANAYQEPVPARR